MKGLQLYRVGERQKLSNICIFFNFHADRCLCVVVCLLKMISPRYFSSITSSILLDPTCTSMNTFPPVSISVTSSKCQPSTKRSVHISGFFLTTIFTTEIFIYNFILQILFKLKMLIHNLKQKTLHL